MPSAKKTQQKKPSSTAAKVTKAKATVVPTPKKKAAPAKPVAKTPPKKKPAPAKKPVAKKPVAKKLAPAKKAPAPKKAAVKKVAPKPVVKNPAPAPVVAKPAKPASVVKPAAPVKPALVVPGPLTIRPFSRSAENKKTAAAAQSAKQQKLSATELKKLHAELVASRNRLTAKTSTMRKVALERNDEINTEEDGIDQFDRLFEIEKIASVQEFVYLIDEALRALDEGVYGICQKCTETIEKARILALPFAKTCIRCQNEAERLKNR